MKRLKKTTLEKGVKVLDDLEMKSVIGGYGNVGTFGKYYHCSCTGNAANPPYKPSWSDWYLNESSVKEAVGKKCVNGGTCYQSGY